MPDPLSSIALRLSPLEAGLAIGALAIPTVVTFGGPLGPDLAALLWFLALGPLLVLAARYGWKGAIGMAALAVLLAVAVQIALAAAGISPSPLLGGVLIVLFATGVGISWLVERPRPGGEPVFPIGTELSTGLSGEVRVLALLMAEISAARRGRPLAVVLFELQRIESPPGKGGIREERRILKQARNEFARILSSTTRRMNLSGQFDSGRFISILDGSDAGGATIFGERVVDAFRASEAAGTGVQAAGGVAAFQEEMSDQDDLLAAAELALQRAQEGGGGMVRVFGEHAASPAGPGTAMRVSAEVVHAPVPVPSRDGGSGDRPPAILSEPGLPGHATWGEGRRILLVEDEAPVRTLIANHLRHRSFEVDEATDGAEGVTRLGEEFDLLITDLRLPGSPGQELVTASKARWPDTPVIVITGYRDAQLAAEALNAGADRYIFKPFGMSELSEHIVELLQERASGLESRRERAARTSPLAPERSKAAREAILNGARALVEAVEVRDPWTRAHSLRVGSYALELFRAMGEEGAGIDPGELRLACELHDIGKISVSDAILNKEGPLTPEEYREIQEHPRVGRRILEPLLGDPLILAVTAWHHERWDGQGYPDRLAGEAIPLPARIVGIADALDAMTSARAYRGGLGWDEAVGQIRTRAGSQFDPGLMDAFETALPALMALFDEWREQALTGDPSTPEPPHEDTP